MNLNEALGLLGKWSREELRTVIEDGVRLPSSGQVVRLNATRLDRDYDITEQDLDAFIALWDCEEPGRWPSIAIRRELLVEAGHRCAICEDAAPLQFHHIVEYNRLRHYDTRHMLALCGTCHTRCTIGQIDRVAQRQYKQRLAALGVGPMYLTTVDAPSRFSWDDLREVLDAMHDALDAAQQPGESRYDFSDVDLEEKNRINNLDPDYFDEMRHEDEPYFGKIRDFLRNPANREVTGRYYELVDEMRRKITADRAMFDGFEQVLNKFADVAVSASPDRFRGRLRVLRALLSFMYLNCDIGKKVR